MALPPSGRKEVHVESFFHTVSKDKECNDLALNIGLFNNCPEVIIKNVVQAVFVALIH